MSFFDGYLFFVYLFILLIPATFLGLREKSLKWYRWAISAFFIYNVYSNNLASLYYFLCYVVFAACIVKLYLLIRTKYGRNKYLYWNVIFLASVPLIYNKIGLNNGCALFAFIGLSYICFRVIQVIIETYDGIIKEINILQFIEFILFFASLSSGPIDRSRRFNEDDDRIWTSIEYAELLATGLYKLILGIFYNIVCSGVFYSILQIYFEGHYDVIHIIGYAYTYGLYMFFDFAGYSMMAVGTSYILGIKMPDNFNMPFLSIDIKDFWNRWHITLSSWFRDFIFTRFILESTRKKRFSHRLIGAVVGLFLTMFIMGLWHGLESCYIIYGIYHGCIMAIYEVYQNMSNFYKRNKNKKWYIVCSWFINLNVIMFGFLIFSGYLSKKLHVL